MILIIGVVTRDISVNATLRQLEEIYTFSLEQLQTRIDYNLTVVANSVSGYTYNKRIAALVNGSDELTPAEIYLNTELQNDLINLMQTSSAIMRVDIYFSDREYLLGTSATYRKDDTDYWAQMFYGMEFVEFQTRYLKGYHGGEFYLEGTNTQKPYLLYVKTVVINHLTKESTYMIVKIDTTDIVSAFLKYEQSVGAPVYLSFNNNQNYVLSAELKPIPSNEIPDPVAYELVGQTEVDGEPFMVIKLELKLLGAMFTVPVPLSVYMDDVNEVSISIIMSTLAIIVLGIVLAIIFSYRNYSPYKRLTTLLKVAPASGNTYKTIEDALNRLLRDNKDLSDKLRTSDERNRQYFIEKLTKGELNKEAVRISLDYYDIPFAGEVVVVCSFAIADTGEHFENDDISSGLLFSSIVNAFQELIGDTEHYFYTSDRNIHCIISLPSQSTETHSNIQSAYEMMVNFFQEQLGVHLVAACSGTYEGIESIHTAFLDSTTELNKKLQTGFADVVNDTFILDVISYINDHYTDPELNASTVAEHFSYNRSYFSHLFKQRTGIALMEFIGKLRFEQAKELLRNKDINLSKVASLSGYTDNRALNQAFKKHADMPASKWKQIYQAQKKCHISVT